MTNVKPWECLLCFVSGPLDYRSQSLLRSSHTRPTIRLQTPCPWLTFPRQFQKSPEAVTLRSASGAVFENPSFLRAFCLCVEREMLSTCWCDASSWCKVSENSVWICLHPGSNGSAAAIFNSDLDLGALDDSASLLKVTWVLVGIILGLATSFQAWWPSRTFWHLWTGHTAILLENIIKHNETL